MTDFVHLHTHTAYSLLDGQGTVKKVLDTAAELGQKAMAITDHGNMYGVIEFYEYAKSLGIKPVIGCEVYVAARTRFDKTHELDSERYHLILLAENNAGYKNLIEIVSESFIDGFYYKPRVDLDLLRENADGIIALSGCMFGPLSRRIAANNYDGAKEYAIKLIDIFGRDNFFIELQNHGLAEQRVITQGLLRLAEELDLDVVCTNDIHYAKRQDAEYQDVLMCIQTGKDIDDPDRFKMESSELYVKSGDEMAELFGNIPGAVENTVRIAERCSVTIEFGKLHLPEFDVPDGISAWEYLNKLCLEGFEKHYPSERAESGNAVFDRMSYELETIKNMGYVDYFLIVRDFINYAKTNGIPVGPGRGSAAGSVVSYCLDITSVDPIKYNLIFERFLNPERVSMPDIDVDFCYERRQEVIDYVNRKYGSDRVCQIITFGTMAARQAVRDTGRALGMPYAAVDNISKQIPSELHMTLEKALESNPRLRRSYEEDPAVRRLINTAKELEGLPRHASTHAAGVVITKDPVYTYVPLQKNDDVITTQFTMTTIERLGLLKMDFLGLRTLTVIHDAVRMAEENHNVKIDIVNDRAYDDPEVYAMISAGNSDGVFQLESPGMKRFMTELKPNCIEDLIAGISLYRPGPMDSIPRYIENRQHPDRIRYKHPMLEPILNVTFGCIIYQEQVMQIVRELGGYSLGRADLIRRAMSKKKADVMAKERSGFIEGAAQHGIDNAVAGAIFDEMTDFASYAFNKSHAAAYAVVAYQTAWLKCHYPVEFFAAMLNSFISQNTTVIKYISAAKREGIWLVPPDINVSGAKFTASKDKKIIYGLGAVKSVGEGVVEEIVKERELGGRFQSFTDFCRRMNGAGAGTKVNKRVIESLIKAGAFDSLGLRRSVLLYEYEPLIDKIAASTRHELPGQMSLFDMDESDTRPDNADNFEQRPELPSAKLLEMEKESMGMYISGHPLDAFRSRLQAGNITQIRSIIENETGEFKADSYVELIGIVTSIRVRRTKANKIMKYLTIEDLGGAIECIVFPQTVDKYDHLLGKDNILKLCGELDITDDGQPPKLRVRTAEILTPPAGKLYIKLEKYDETELKRIGGILGGASGNVEVCIYFADTKKQMTAKKKISPDDSRIRTFIKLYGDENVVLKA